MTGVHSLGEEWDSCRPWQGELHIPHSSGTGTSSWLPEGAWCQDSSNMALSSDLVLPDLDLNCHSGSQ